MKRLLSLPILFCLAMLSLSAQQSAETNFYDGIYFYEEEEDYEEARFLFSEVLKKEPRNANAMYWLGMCYNHIEGQEHKGIPYFKQATQSISLRYKANRYSEKRAPHHPWWPHRFVNSLKSNAGLISIPTGGSCATSPIKINLHFLSL